MPKMQFIKFFLITTLVVSSVSTSLFLLNFNNTTDNLKIAKASSDDQPSLIQPDPCPGYVQPSSVYNMTNPNGVKSGQTWLGNSFCGSNVSDPNNRIWNSAPSGISDIFAQPDGTVLTTATFEESAKGLGAWKDGKIAYPRVFDETVVRAGRTITGDGTGNISFYPQVERNIGNAIIIGEGNHKHRSAYQLANSNEVFAITGMAALNGKLYSTSSITNKIKVWNYTTPTAGLTDANQNWDIPTKPGKLVFDKNNTLWLLNDPEGVSPTLTQYSTAGVKLKQFSFPSGYVPSSIVFGDNNQAYIGDSGIDQQIKINDVSGSSLVQTGTFGVQYGSSAGLNKGLIGSLRFRGTFNGLGLDASGNIYMTTGYGNDTTLSSYKLSDGTRNWMIENNQFQKIVAADPGSDNGDNLNFYSPNLRTNFDFSKSKGKQWATVAQVEDFDQGLNKASISDLNRFSFLTRVNGQLLTYGIDSKTSEGPVIGEQLIIRKNTPGNGELQSDSGAIICNGVQSNKTLKIWRDTNNNGTKESDEIMESSTLPTSARQCNDNFGFHVDENSGIWKYWPTIGLVYLPLQSIDSYGNPVYTWESARTWTGNNFPIGLNGTDPVAYGYFTFNYDAKRDIATFLVNTNEATGKYKITVVDNFLTGNLTPKWTTMVPINGCGCFFRTHISVAGDLVMLNNNLDADPASPTLNQDMDANAGRTYMWNINTGDYLGISLNDRSLFKYASGTIDAQYQTYGYQRNNGEILNMVEDVYETKTRITQIQSPVTRLTNAGSNTLPGRDNMGNRVLNTQQVYNIPQGNAPITASASMKEGAISKVEFFVKDITNPVTTNPTETKIGEDTNGIDGWSYNWNTSSIPLNNKYQIYTRASGAGTPVVNTSEPFEFKIVQNTSSSSSISSSLNSSSQNSSSQNSSTNYSSQSVVSSINSSVISSQNQSFNSSSQNSSITSQNSSNISSQVSSQLSSINSSSSVANSSVVSSQNSFLVSSANSSLTSLMSSVVSSLANPSSTNSSITSSVNLSQTSSTSTCEIVVPLSDLCPNGVSSSQVSSQNRSSSQNQSSNISSSSSFSSAIQSQNLSQISSQNTSSTNTSSQISSQNSSLIPAQNSASPVRTGDVILADNGFVNVQMTNNSCNGFDSLQKIVVNSTINLTNNSTILNQNFVEFKATCPQTVIKTFWKDLDVNKEYRFVKYNPLLNVKKYDYPATLTKEIINGKLNWVSTHTVNDNGNGDFDNLNGKIWDPYTLELVVTNVVPVPNPTPTNNQNTNPIINPIATIYNWFQTTIQNLTQSIFGQNNTQNQAQNQSTIQQSNQPNISITNNNSNTNNKPTTNNNQNTNFSQSQNQALSPSGNGQNSFSENNQPINNVQNTNTNQGLEQTNSKANSGLVRTGGWQTNSTVGLLALLSIGGLWLIGKHNLKKSHS